MTAEPFPFEYLIHGGQLWLDAAEVVAWLRTMDPDRPRPAALARSLEAGTRDLRPDTLPRPHDPDRVRLVRGEA